MGESMSLKTRKNFFGSVNKDVFMRILIISQVIFFILFDGFFRLIPILENFHHASDIVTIIMAFVLIFDFRKVINIKEKWIFIPLLLYSVICVATAIFNRVEPMLFIWAVRNTFRFFVFYIACIIYVKKEDVIFFLKHLPKVQFINFPLVIIEYVVVECFPELFSKISQDHIGGIFGMEIGCNGQMNIFLCAILIICLSNAFEREKIEPFTVFIFLSTAICAAIAEIKFFFPEVIGIFVICGVLYYKSIKRKPIFFVKLSGLTLLSIIIGVAIMYIIYPYALMVYSDYPKYEHSAASTYVIGRMNAFSFINDHFFENSILRSLFGFGFGSCEYSDFSLLASDFYRKYGYYHYYWFSHQMLYLETGLIGFITFAMHFVITALQGFISYLKNNKNVTVSVFCVAFSAVLFVNLFYNNQIRSDGAYFSYFLLAFMPIVINSTKADKSVPTKGRFYE